MEIQMLILLYELCFLFQAFALIWFLALIKKWSSDPGAVKTNSRVEATQNDTIEISKYLG